MVIDMSFKLQLLPKSDVITRCWNPILETPTRLGRCPGYDKAHCP